VYNAVLAEFIERSRAVKSDPVWQLARQLPHRTKDERAARRAAFDAVARAHGFTAGVAQSFASSRRSVARINARRKARAAKRQSRSARTTTTNQPTALAA
jgi:hypothetical protein